MGTILTAEPIYQTLKQQIQQKAAALPAMILASVVAGQEYSSCVYLESQKRLAQELGVEYRLIPVSDQNQQEIISLINTLNKDKTITGILLNKPFPPHWDEQSIYEALSDKKDIEGVHPYNLGRIVLHQPRYIPPTVLSVLEFIRLTECPLKGKDVTLVGFSPIIGKPLALLLADELATVSITHIGTFEADRLAFYVQNADIVITAVGKAEIIKGRWIKEGAVVIDVGIAQKQGKTMGDIEFDVAKDRAAYITPVPGGVGKLTTLFLFSNLIQAAQQQNG